MLLNVEASVAKSIFSKVSIGLLGGEKKCLELVKKHGHKSGKHTHKHHQPAPAAIIQPIIPVVPQPKLEPIVQIPVVTQAAIESAQSIVPAITNTNLVSNLNTIPNAPAIGDTVSAVIISTTESNSAITQEAAMISTVQSTTPEAIVESIPPVAPTVINQPAILTEVASNSLPNLPELPSNLPAIVTEPPMKIDATSAMVNAVAEPDSIITQAAAAEVISNNALPSKIDANLGSTNQVLPVIIDQQPVTNPGVKATLTNWLKGMKESAYEHRIAIGATIAVAAVIIGGYYAYNYYYKSEKKNK